MALKKPSVETQTRNTSLWRLLERRGEMRGITNTRAPESGHRGAPYPFTDGRAGPVAGSGRKAVLVEKRPRTWLECVLASCGQQNA